MNYVWEGTEGVTHRGYVYRESTVWLTAGSWLAGLIPDWQWVFNAACVPVKPSGLLFCRFKVPKERDFEKVRESFLAELRIFLNTCDLWLGGFGGWGIRLELRWSMVFLTKSLPNFCWKFWLQCKTMKIVAASKMQNCMILHLMWLSIEERVWLWYCVCLGHLLIQHTFKRLTHRKQKKVKHLSVTQNCSKVSHVPVAFKFNSNVTWPAKRQKGKWTRF